MKGKNMRHESPTAQDHLLLKALISDIKKLQANIEESSRLSQSTKETLAIHMAVNAHIVGEFRAKLGEERHLKSDTFARAMQWASLAVNLIMAWALLGHHVNF